MITDISEYLFVDGDLDRIIIDGDVMPLRTGTTSTGKDRKRILRGEDVALLMEAFCERLNLAALSNPYPRTRTFTRKIGVNMRALLDALRTEVDSFGFVRSFPAAEAHDVSVDYFTDYRATSAIRLDDLATSADAFNTGKSLALVEMQRMFDDMKAARIVMEPVGDFMRGALVGERHDRDPDFPMPGTVVTSDGYHLRGGAGTDHPYAGGGWSLYTSDDTLSWDLNPPILTTPSRLEAWAVERYTMTRSLGGQTTTSIKYDLVKIGDGTVGADGEPFVVDTAAARRARLVSAMSRYWGLTPGYTDTQTLVVDVESFIAAHEWFVEVGDHTRWW